MLECDGSVDTVHNILHYLQVKNKEMIEKHLYNNQNSMKLLKKHWYTK